MKTEFQKRFVLKQKEDMDPDTDRFYTGKEIRKAIAECFPFDGQRHRGLSHIVFLGRRIDVNRMLDLEALIPDIRSKIVIPYNMARTYYYGVDEGEAWGPDPVASSIFVPTDRGYLCDEMMIQGRKIRSESEGKALSLYEEVKESKYRVSHQSGRRR
jgi:hypothetical protein